VSSGVCPNRPFVWSSGAASSLRTWRWSPCLSILPDFTPTYVRPPIALDHLDRDMLQR
jgi:hypothetical protein